MPNLSLSPLPPEPQALRTISFDLHVTLPATTPMADVAQALTRLATALDGTWAYRHPVDAPRGRFEVEGRP